MAKRKKEVEIPLCGVHTVNIVTNGRINWDVFTFEMLVGSVSKASGTASGKESFRYNVEKNLRERKNGWDEDPVILSEVEKVVKEAGEKGSEAAGGSGWQLKRIDFKFDWMFTKPEELERLNRYLLVCFDQREKSKDRDKRDLRVRGKDHITQSIVARSSYYELEFYDKKIETNGNADVLARLEIRHKRVDGKEIGWIVERVILLLEDLKKRGKKAEAYQNRELLEYWKNYEPATQNTTHKRMAFLREKKKELYTKEQVKNLLEAMGADNPDGVIKNFQNRTRIRLTSRAELENYIDLLVGLLKYFSQN